MITRSWSPVVQAPWQNASTDRQIGGAVLLPKTYVSQLYACGERFAMSFDEEINYCSKVQLLGGRLHL